MDEELMLNGEWEFQDRDLDADPLSEAWLLTNFNTDWMIMKVPGDIHEGLLKAGKIQEPLVGLNSYECRWTEERAWWFRKAFMGEPDWKEADAIELELAGLDSNADVFLNGFRIGSHRNAFYPFLLNLKPWLLLEKNVLLVPNRAIIRQGTTANVQVMSSTGAVKTQTIQTETSDNRNTEVTQGLNEGDKVILQNASTRAATPASGGVFFGGPGGIGR